MRYLISIIIVLLCFTLNTQAQTIAGIKVNGVSRTLGDTIKICINTSLNYSSGAINANTTIWALPGSTPGTFNGPTPGVIVYNTAGYYTTEQIGRASCRERVLNLV